MYCVIQEIVFVGSVALDTGCAWYRRVEISVQYEKHTLEFPVPCTLVDPLPACQLDVTAHFTGGCFVQTFHKKFGYRARGELLLGTAHT